MKAKNSFYHSYYPYIRIALYLTVGLFNTVLIRAEDIGSWKNYAGYAFLLLALIDSVVLIVKYFKSKQ